MEVLTADDVSLFYGPLRLPRWSRYFGYPRPIRVGGWGRIDLVAELVLDLLILEDLADAHVDDDLHELRKGNHVPQRELLGQVRRDFVRVESLEFWRCRLGIHCSSLRL